MGSERTFSGDQLRDVLKRAAELQGSGPSTPEGPALTAAELEEVAKGAGLDPAHIRQAVREMDAARVRRRTTDASDTHLFVERWIELPMTSRTKDIVRAELSHLHDVPLQWTLSNPFEWTTTKQVGDTWELNFRSLSRSDMRVSLQPRGDELDELRLRLARPVSAGGRPLFEAVCWSLLVAAISVPAFAVATSQALTAVLGVLLVYAASVAVLYQGFSHWRKSQHASLEKLGDQLADALIAAEAPDPLGTAASTGRRARHEPSLKLEDEPRRTATPEDSSPERSRQRG